MENNLNYLLNHQEECLKQYTHLKEVKQKIVFFIGTLFITVMFGSGFLIYKSVFSETILPITTSTSTSAEALNLYKKEAINLKALFDKLYVLQYLIMHCFFFLLYMYYTYNNIQEKIFLIELQCCQDKIFKLNASLKALIPVQFSLIKRFYIDGSSQLTYFKVRGFKDVGNFLLVIIYSIFSFIPLSFDKQFVFVSNNDFRIYWIWIILGIIAIGLLYGMISASTYLIRKTKFEIKKEWGCNNEDI